MGDGERGIGAVEVNRFLVSYAYMSPPMQEALFSSGAKILIDSGAFTAWKSGKPIELEAYRDWLLAHQDKVWGYLNLDVVGDPEGSEVNLAFLRAAGLDPIPVITRGMTLRQAMPMQDSQGRVAIGGLVGTPDKLKFVTALRPALAGKKVHVLGTFNPEILNLPDVATADASTGTNALRFGALRFIYRGARHSLTRAHFTNVLSPAAAYLLAVTGATAEGLRGPWVNSIGVFREVAFRVAVLNAARLSALTSTEVFDVVAGKGDLLAFVRARAFLVSKGLL